MLFKKENAVIINECGDNEVLKNIAANQVKACDEYTQVLVSFIKDGTEFKYVSSGTCHPQFPLPETLVEYFDGILETMNRRVSDYRRCGARNFDEYAATTSASDAVRYHLVVSNIMSWTSELVEKFNQCLVLSKVTNCYIIIVSAGRVQLPMCALGRIGFDGKITSSGDLIVYN